MLLPGVWLLGITEEFTFALNFVPQEGACALGSSSYYLWITLVHLFMPVVLVTVLYGHMIFRLKTSMNSKNGVTSARRNDIMQKAKSNVFKTMLLITICYAICYICNSIYVTLYLGGIIQEFSGMNCFFICESVKCEFCQVLFLWKLG